MNSCIKILIPVSMTFTFSYEFFTSIFTNKSDFTELDFGTSDDDHIYGEQVMQLAIHPKRSKKLYIRRTAYAISDTVNS